MKSKRWSLGASFLLVLAGFAGAAAPSEPSLGHKDFYPSPERPVGFRGDGNGYFPGATPVAEWREGTVGTGKDARGEFLMVTDKKAHNIVWKVEMPSWANTQPVVVGDRVFTTAEPNLLVCVDANTGKLLWTAAANPWELAGVDKAKADKIQKIYDIGREVVPHFDHMRGTGTMSRFVPSSEFAPIADAFVQKVMPRIVPALKELDPEGAYDEAAKATADALKRYGPALVEAEKTGLRAATAKHDPLNGELMRLGDTLGRRIQSLGGSRDYGKWGVRYVPLEEPWGHLVGFCASTPVSDGRYVYASFGQGQTVCYDLNGKRVWGAEFPPIEQKDGLDSLHAPLLAGDVLVDMHGGAEVLRGLDKRTGKVLWEAPTAPPDVNKNGYNVGSHKVATLGDGDRAVKVIVTTLCGILRASDGKLMGTLPYEFSPAGGPSMVCSGDIVIKGACGDNYHAPFVAYRLKLVGADKVEATEIWRTPRASTPYYQSVMLSPAALIMASREHPVLDPATGKVLLRYHDAEAIAGYSNVLAGNVFLWAADGSDHWGSRGDEVFGSFGAADAADPAKVRFLTNQNVLGGVNKPRVPAMEEYAPELYAMKFYTGNAFGWPAHFMHTDTGIFPSGNRLFIRSVSHLYCIGDPSAPYDWNATSRPKEITEELTVK